MIPVNTLNLRNVRRVFVYCLFLCLVLTVLTDSVTRVRTARNPTYKL